MHKEFDKYDLKFNKDGYAVATQRFWDYWNSGGKKTTMYSPGKYRASEIGMHGNRWVWLVFASQFVREDFEIHLQLRRENRS